jgi:cell division protease FtsH
MNNINKNILIWVAVFAVILSFGIFQGDGLKGDKHKLTLSEFFQQLDEKHVGNVRIDGANVEGKLTDGTEFSAYIGNYPDVITRIAASGTHFDLTPPNTKMNYFMSLLLSAFPMLLLIGVWIFFMRQMQGGGKGGAMGFGKSKAKLLSEKNLKITFKDVAGIDEAQDELQEIVDFLRDPSKFQKLGGKIPKGCLLIGPPGTGKTLLARAIAGEANVPFFSISGSDFVEMFVGVGASRVRDMFEQGKKNAPCIIFIDEIDAVGRHRGIGVGGGNDEREQTLNQMLVEMDGFEANEGVVIIAATNRPDVLDPALLRPGRFDRQITVPNPDLNGREKILNVHLKKVKQDGKIDARIIARGTPGFSGAELANLVNEAALLAARKNKQAIDMIDLEEAKDKVMMGSERRSMAMSDAEKKLTAYHEGGHALVGIYLPASDPIHKATIIPRGRALGMVMRLPENDRFSMARDKMEADIAVAMAGRVSEEMIFGHDKVTSGASSDIQMATKMARAMVTEWGLSEKIGTIYHGASNEDMYSHSRGGATRSNNTSELIDEEVKALVDQGYNVAKKILTKHLSELHLLAQTLIERETLSGTQIKNLLAGKDINAEEVPVDPKPTEEEVKAKRKSKSEE